MDIFIKKYKDWGKIQIFYQQDVFMKQLKCPR